MSNNKYLVMMMFLLLIPALVKAQEIKENGVTVEYEFKKKHLIAKIMLEPLKEPYELDIFIDDKVSEYGEMGFVSTTYSFNNGSGGLVHKGAIYSLKTNKIDEICRAITVDLNNKEYIKELRNKSTVIINIINRLLTEDRGATEAGAIK